MKNSIEIFLPASLGYIDTEGLGNIASCDRVAAIHLWVPEGFVAPVALPDKVECVETASIQIGRAHV